jgi:hypothetical protein
MTSETVFFKVLENVSPPPKKLLEGINRTLRPSKAQLGNHHERFLTNWYGRNFKAGVNTRIICPELEQWVKENLTIHTVDTGVNYVTYTEESGLPISTGAHTDGTREFVLLWNIESGGADAELTYWREKGKPLYRAPKTHGADLSRLELVAKTKLPEGRWLLLDTRIMHSVENLTDTRISLQISLLNKLALQTVPGMSDLSDIKEF